MDGAERIESAFRHLLESLPYKRITVFAICEEAGIARKTFYSYFHNKEDIIAFVFKRDVLDPQTHLHKLLSSDTKRSNPEIFTAKIYQSILEDKDFYYKLVGPLVGADDTFLRVASRCLFDHVSKIVESRLYGRDRSWKSDYTAYFFATSQAIIIQRWISDGMVIPPDELAAWYQHVTLGFWQSNLPEAY